MNTLFRAPAVRTALRSTTQAARMPTLGARRTIMTIEKAKYTAHATASGQGRNGTVKSDDDAGLELRLAMPTSLGGKGDGQNPEQLFAMGYAACFLSALQLVASQKGKTEAAKNAIIRTSVHIGKPEGSDGFGLAVDINVNGVEDQALIDAAHAACPYSRALKDGAVVNVTKGGEPNPGPANSQKGTDSNSGSSSGSKSESSNTQTTTSDTGKGPLYDKSDVASKSSGSSESTSKSSESSGAPGSSSGSGSADSSKGDTDANGTTQSGSGTAGYQ